ncbi:ester cyclase [Streptomyces sp. NPDC005407]|jgi:predicted ester cyclase|uniref:ester cyclase n=1 Tax=Streptomyces sp. NPDC005407 TaxID=3155340 RepID=UPI0033A40D13
MSAERSALRRRIRGGKHHQVTTAHEWLERSPRFRVHVSLLDGSSDTAIRGVDGLTAWIKQSRAIFKDFKITTQVDPCVDGKHIVGRWAATGTYAGGVPGATAPIGTKISFTGADIPRTEHGKVVEYWLHSDTIALLGQLGVGAK